MNLLLFQKQFPDINHCLIINQYGVPNWEYLYLKQSFLCMSSFTLYFLALLLPGLNRMETPFWSFFAQRPKKLDPHSH